VLRLEPTAKEMPLSTLAGVYRQIYLDLDDAIELFTASEWTRPSGDFWTPNIHVAYATYARAAINKLDYGKAIEMSQKAREGYPLMTVEEYKSGFYSPNREWIWGSYQGTEQNQQWSGFHAYMGYNGYASTSTDNGVKRIVKSYLEKIPATDIRKGLFFDPSAYPASAFDPLNGKLYVDREHPQGNDIKDSLKRIYPAAQDLGNSRFCSYMQFKIARDPASTSSTNVGNLNHFRSSEMYLIEAEAQFKDGNEKRARELLVELTKDSGRNPSYSCTKSGDDLFDEIKFMAQIELWGEGFDWFMVKRWGERIVHKSFADGGNFLAAVAGEFGPEEKNKQTFVIPLLETDFNPLAKGGNN
jgi:tetratricopeptide (TPR) repeat protein